MTVSALLQLPHNTIAEAIMRVSSILSRWLTNCSVVGHQARGRAVIKGVEALVRGGQLALTHLGRHRPGAARVKHHIKAMDRLLGNRHLHAERDGIYRAICASVMVNDRRPVLLVDRANFELNRQWVMIKAAVPVGGRAITICEQVYPFRRYNSPGAHRGFLRAPQRIVPPHCTPTVVTGGTTADRSADVTGAMGRWGSTPAASASHVSSKPPPVRHRLVLSTVFSANKSCNGS